jgi:hypothetical protein
MARPLIRHFVIPSDPGLEKGLNALVDELNRLGKMEVSGAAFSNGPEGPKIAVPDMASNLATVRTPSGGIQAMSGNVPGSATCTFYEWDGTNETLGTRTDTVLNEFGAVSGNRKAVVRFDKGSWWFVVQACS